MLFTKNVLCGELKSGARSVGRPFLHFRDVVNRDLRQLKILSSEWECISKIIWRARLRQSSLVLDHPRSSQSD